MKLRLGGYMKRTFRRLCTFGLVVVVVAFQIISSSRAQTVQISLPYYSVGIIYDAATNKPIGSGFVFRDAKTVVTARHVLVDENTGLRRMLIFKPIKGVVPGAEVPALRLLPLKDDKNSDIAVLKMTGESPCREALQPTTGDLKVGDNVLYAGFDTRQKNAYTVSLGAYPISNIYFDGGLKFFQIVGDARPGYSGGPVFGRGAEVIGIILRGRPSGDGEHNIFDAVSVQHVPNP
jgi:S1-C subfamily serine protease